MAKQIRWSLRAENDRLQIFRYWNKRNKSRSYSKKLNELFNSTIETLANHSDIGRTTDVEKVKVLMVRDYLIIYEDYYESIFILTIWDSRRNPSELEKYLGDL